MAETTAEKTTCEKCGADIRENTSFCYNCGDKFGEVAAETNGSAPAAMSDEAKSALDDLAAKLKVDDGRLKLAADERKKARVAPKRTKEDVWQGIDAPTGRGAFVVLVVIFVIVV